MTMKERLGASLVYMQANKFPYDMFYLLVCIATLPSLCMTSTPSKASMLAFESTSFTRHAWVNIVKDNLAFA